MLSAAELHRRGRAASSAGRHGEASRLLHRARARAADNEIRARIEVSLAYTEAELGTVDAGIVRCRSALELPGVPTHVQGLIHSQLGLLHMRSGDGTSAVRDLERAGPLLDPHDHRSLGVLHLTLGNVYLQRGESRRAAAQFRTAITEYELADAPLQTAKATHNLGYAHLLGGEIVPALQCMDAARPSFDELGPVYQAVGDQDRAEALVAAGMRRDAVAALRASAAAFARRRMRKRQAEALLVLARILLQDDPREAARVARRAARLFTGNGSRVWALRAQAVGLEGDLLSGRRRPAVLHEAATVTRRLRRERLPQEAGALALQRIRALVARGDLRPAAALLHRTRLREEAPLDNRILYRQAASELASARNGTAEALREAKIGLAELHRWQAAYGSLDLHSSMAGHGRALAVQGLATAVRSGRPEVVFEWSERARALATRVSPVRPPVRPEHADALRRLRELTNHADGVPAGRAAEEIAALRRSIRQGAWQGEGSGVVTDPVPLDAIQQHLANDDATLIAHLLTDDHLMALTITSVDATLHELGPAAPVRSLLQGLQADLDVAAGHLPAALRSVVLAGLADRLGRLADHLVAPLGSAVTGGPTVLVPTAALAGVPWNLLDGLRDVPLVLARSATLWASRAHWQTIPDVVGLVAGPDVLRAPEEVHRAERAWKQGHRATALTATGATCEKVAELAERVDLLHLAAHGRHSADNPLFSGVQLQDGPWFGYDIDRLRHAPELVVLSACELGRSTVRWGEEAIGMPAAWLHAGSRMVIASPASVDDDVACEVLAATHQRLAQGISASHALAAATAGLGSTLPCTFTCFGAGW